MGWQPHLVHEDVIKQVVEQHPRLKWSGCFSKAIKAEIEVRLLIFPPKLANHGRITDNLWSRPNRGATPLLFRALPKLWLTTRSWRLMIRLVPAVSSIYDGLERV
jgi:hypothetical protein